MESLNTSLSILHRPYLQPFPHRRRRPHPIMTLRSNPETQSSNSISRPQKARPISSNPRFLNNRSDAHLSKNLSGGVSVGKDQAGVGRNGGRGSTMEAIVEKLKKFGYVDRKTDVLEGNSADVASESALGFKKDEVVRFPWEKAVVEEEEERRKKSARSWSRTSLAELTLPEGELRRLRNLALRTKERTKIGGTGVTRAVVEAIREKWRTAEVVRLKCEGPPTLNMKRMHEILERKTGGLVIWRSGTSISIYRGVGYEHPSEEPVMQQSQTVSVGGLMSFRKASEKVDESPRENDTVNDAQTDPSSSTTSIDEKNGPRENDTVNDAQTDPSSSITSIDEKNDPEKSPEFKYEDVVDKLLDSLGPRFTDWPGSDPLPVDADLLPGVVHGYKPPFRILPYGVRCNLGLKEATKLRRVATVLPPHFALGRSRQHQGLAAAMVKLWERSSIAKVALKRGVQLTVSERMADEIKRLTGGTVLSRTKEFIVFYRGKDFLSPAVTEALLERERLTKALQDVEEEARLRASSSFMLNIETTEEDSGIAGTLGETLEADARWGKKLDKDKNDKIIKAVEAARHADVVRKLERKLRIALRKVKKAERALAKVEAFLKPTEHKSEPESITDEERFMFRKLGLKMKAFLLLGRRGVFDGTVENMHLHWKYRELVKILMNAKTFAQARNVALSLEAESGGTLVSVDKVSKQYAIIVYRGKDYQRPPTLRPKNLLTKRKALARSIELQRSEALNNHISTLHQRVEQLRAELGQMETVKGKGDEALYAKLDTAYASEDEEDTEDEGDEAYLETYNGSASNDSVSEDDGDDFSNDYDDGDDVLADDFQSLTNFPYDDAGGSED
ncbi:hypothetical protein QJS10_CPA08g00200 [Acorus calamus]|uniref:CRM-domain containing factor CFM3, chloroplastic/mitochondrial n=1 Tax=Acorus calamus TaxID=4465 RepID=A0AAV9EAS8_ACOCL|nr:hypothetical protein QJS10_CPA08g00200 [Acorus calamus]